MEFLNEDSLILSEHYEQGMNEVVLPALAKAEEKFTVKGAGGKEVRGSLYRADQPAGTVLIVHGFTENAFKFSEIIFSLLSHHYSVIAYDHRGHGYSWRDPDVTNLSVTHVDRFDDYIADLKSICDNILAGCPKPRFVFSHSMGGAVTALFMEQYTDVFDRAVFCAPMIAPNCGPVPAFAASLLCGASGLFGRRKNRVSFIPPYSGPEDFDTSCATDPNRFAWYDRIKASTPVYQNSCPTYGWTKESIGVTRRILAKGKPERITCPVLLFTAESDGSVLPDAQERFASELPDCRHVFVKGAKHEIYRSTDDVLFPWWHSILEFLKG